MDEKLLASRQATHGSYRQYATAETALKQAVARNLPDGQLNAVQASVLGMVMCKIARIITGSANHIDHWRDIQGYVQRAVEDLESTPGSTDTVSNKVTLREDGVWEADA